jgi:deoxyribose-phosphate aldolase
MSDRTDADLARLALSCLDLTSLRGDEDRGAIEALADRAAAAVGAPAALCVYPAWVPAARAVLDRRGCPRVRVATVVSFPLGDASPQRVADDIAQALADGADEIDLVLPWRALKAAADGVALHGLDMASAEAACRASVQAARAACGPRLLKVILETGELGDPGLVERACHLALDAGADFLKTSTGKARVHATPEAVTVMARVLAAAGGGRVGLKVAGGVQTIEDVRRYVDIVESQLGPAALVPQRLRFGASSLWPALAAAAAGDAGPSGGGDGGY